MRMKKCPSLIKCPLLTPLFHSVSKNKIKKKKFFFYFCKYTLFVEDSKGHIYYYKYIIIF